MSSRPNASKEQYEEALAALVEAQRFLDTNYRRAEADKIIAKEKAALDDEHWEASH
jgi:ABC-type nitrate/sulfonate/bicarbonate transport system substrate-binding protein